MIAKTLAHGMAARTFPDIELQVASTREQRESVFQLVYRSYRDAGLCEPNAAELRFTPYQLLTTTDIFFAELREEVICTLSLVRDGELGLPMENLYAEQVEERRAAGIYLAEVSCLADRRDNPARFFKLFCDLSRLMVQSAENQSVDQLLIVVHPRHAALYTRFMAFEKIGEARDYSAVNGNPAVPLCLDLNKVRQNQPPCWERFFGEKIPERFLQAEPITTAECDYFLSLQEHERESIALWDSELDSGVGNDCDRAEVVLCA